MAPKVFCQEDFCTDIKVRLCSTTRKAAQKLKVECSQVTPPFPEQTSLYDHIRKAPVRKAQVEQQNGNVEEAFKTAAGVIDAEYEWPFQSHASMGPACALVEIKNGDVICWSGTQKSHFLQQGLASEVDLRSDPDRVSARCAKVTIDRAAAGSSPRTASCCQRRRILPERRSHRLTSAPRP